MAGFAYLVIFDALGMLNIFISSVVTSNREFREANLKRPFGVTHTLFLPLPLAISVLRLYSAQRSEIVFALATTLFLLFAAMYTTKESIEHMMLEEAGEKAGAKHEVSGGFGVGSIVMMMIAVAVTLISSVGFSNHRNFAQILRTNTTTHGVTYSTIYPQRPSAVTVVFNNIFTVATLSCAATVILAALFDHAASAGSHDDHHAGYADKLASFAESFVMFYLGGPTAAAIAKMLLQTSPDTVSGGLEMRLREIQQDPSVLSIDRAHFWQNTYGQYVGTLEVRARPDASEQHVLQLVHQKLEGVLNVNGASAQGLGNGGAYGKPPVGAEAGAGELTVQIVRG
ncbi:cation efflux family-domain-containing protein [Jimgerdemannia flammicorona]|uniref:Cation efflux family-domain-containing protein n=1 Tax=Jimgerdemannia flammicorona TaxID=994334 RepID=A0A433PYK9_9FUNG|nr:cation efflux family-domain-containing protein [Jimgerdemannia flammicorona]